ncbi:MAG TPA: RdgB/HAM1 family non-canonical purine NTP pyrophosphatase [Phycisphaerae bacterium]|nr:RdgB/HAM1 family non-canonical purine NTP pyrophosphatase [Phycisphaerae bacterium]HRR86794.1 RdgB/HAM1 family non-canonical purine NTP pyrophosphatase [Phycisphaerae bacterium]
MREILLATGNAGKAREMKEILSGVGDEICRRVRWRHLQEFTGWPEAIEDGRTFLENAQSKALYYARLSGLWTIADDSGLEVDALGGEPGVRSARYAGEPKSDQANNALLVERLAGVPDDQRTARFRCAVALADGRQVLASAEGTVEGRIIDHPRGANGFGYDPHFLVVSAGMTAAEMPPEQKHAVSHRGQALRKLAVQLAALLSERAVY